MIYNLLMIFQQTKINSCTRSIIRILFAHYRSPEFGPGHEYVNRLRSTMVYKLPKLKKSNNLISSNYNNNNNNINFCLTVPVVTRFLFVSALSMTIISFRLIQFVRANHP